MDSLPAPGTEKTLKTLEGATMAGVTPNLSEPRRIGAPLTPEEFEAHISEFAADVAGAMSPFGDDVEFPLPSERLGYEHPGPANRPRLAGD
jgi:succinate dehydrogenase / fumarate reductase iron-sulfur subunit